ncbi:Pentulose kinase [Guyanagaster necrorhizus]|uniref:Pentulose kinase n=1 Tax=Guyanagaster necrorhizus TaxID=856835 RepID=A0A9P7VU86_9AGAR|nr:Pentulose kinase [Guyanagaster necrorhizus MCA 3950]KAG7445991.1 Pentulose kinase [Guyanagaster necrorhizus MCA 3950]
MSLANYYIGVDVGTGSARASLVKDDGTTVASFTKETITYRDPENHRIFEQSTNNIWDAISTCIRTCLNDSGVSPSSVKGIGFDATCSLAVSDFQGEPVIITGGDQLGQNGDRNVILWADHRAEKEADLINSTGSVVLDYVGGTMSLEMEIPKVLWLKNHMDAALFSRCQFFDLPDFLTYRATTDSTRSCCSVTCKCSFVPNKGWQADFFKKIGLQELVECDYNQIGAANMKVLTAGLPVGQGLSKRAAEEFGLVEGTPVGSGVIDAYAGWMGTVAARTTGNDGQLSTDLPSVDESSHRLAAVAGTSTCHLVQSREGVFVNGVWGPYKDPLFRGWWMNEGGQSSTGQLIDFMLITHPAYNKLVELGKEQKKNIHVVLQEMLARLKTESKVDSLTELTKDIHLYPDLHGNRSPIADPRMKGSIMGIALDDTLHDLARKYNVTLEAIALQTRHIVDEMNAKGHRITSIYMSGGQAKNIPMMQLFANTCGMPIILPFDHAGAVVLGAAMLGRFAAEANGKGEMSNQEQGDVLWKIMVEMTLPGTMVSPLASPKEKQLLEAKYKIFRETILIQKRWRQEMEDACK